LGRIVVVVALGAFGLGRGRCDDVILPVNAMGRYAIEGPGLVADVQAWPGARDSTGQRMWAMWIRSIEAGGRPKWRRAGP